LLPSGPDMCGDDLTGAGANEGRRSKPGAGWRSGGAEAFSSAHRRGSAIIWPHCRLPATHWLTIGSTPTSSAMRRSRAQSLCSSPGYGVAEAASRPAVSCGGTARSRGCDRIRGRLAAGLAAGLIVGLALCADPVRAATEKAETVAVQRTVQPRTSPPAAAEPDSEPIVAAKPAGAGLVTKPPIANPLWVIPLRSLTAMRERPLFSPSRRPPPPVTVAPVISPAPPPPVVEPDHPLLELVGTVVGESEGIGIFVDDATKAVVRLRIGQDHGGWLLRSVGPREVRFEKGSRRATLALPAPDQSGASAQPAGVRSGETWRDGDGRVTLRHR
jgi:general secretion pathway protein N